MALDSTLSLLNVPTRGLGPSYKRRKGLGGASVVTESLAMNATDESGRNSPEFSELFRSFTSQSSSHIKYSPEFFDDKPSTPLSVEHGPRVEFTAALRERFARIERARQVPPFYIPECDTENFCVLQQRYLAAEREDSRNEMDQLLKEMIILFAEHGYRLTTSMGVIEFPCDSDTTTATGSTTIPPRVMWMLKRASCFCSQCERPLQWESTYNKSVNRLTWYSLPCRHAVRFCEDCHATARCWLCGVKARGKRKRVYQDVDDGGIHKACMVSACDCCELLV